MCYSVLPCVTVCYCVLLCVTVCFHVLQCVIVCFHVLQCVLLCDTVSYCVLLWTGWHSVLYSWTPDREQKDWLSLLLNSCPVPNYRMPFEFSMLHRIEIIVESFEEKNSKFLSLYCHHTRCPLKQFFIIVVIVIRTGMDGSSEWAINCLIIRRGNTKPLLPCWSASTTLTASPTTPTPKPLSSPSLGGLLALLLLHPGTLNPYIVINLSANGTVSRMIMMIDDHELKYN